MDFIKFQSYIKPICIDFNTPSTNVPSGLQSTVSGWGQIESGGEISEQLKIIQLPTINYTQCKEDTPTNYHQYITYDKFCAGVLTGESVCRGDSGSGLVVPRMVDGQEKFYLYGIVSNGPRLGDSCDNTKYSVFTNIYKYLHMINKAYSDHIGIVHKKTYN